MKLRTRFKELVEIAFWKYKKLKEGDLTNWHYEEFFTTYFDIDKSFYENKCMLDIGCGPRGSLEWAPETAQTYGLDPLADRYLKMGASSHRMKYFSAYSEKMPFEDDFFDIISSFNSLDHVEDVTNSVKEIKRTLKSGGLFLLIVDVHPWPTPTEPQNIKWNFAEEFFPDFKVLKKMKYKHKETGMIYRNARHAIAAEESDKNGLLSLVLKKP